MKLDEFIACEIVRAIGWMNEHKVFSFLFEMSTVLLLLAQTTAVKCHSDWIWNEVVTVLLDRHLAYIFRSNTSLVNQESFRIIGQQIFLAHCVIIAGGNRASPTVWCTHFACASEVTYLVDERHFDFLHIHAKTVAAAGSTNCNSQKSTHSPTS